MLLFNNYLIRGIILMSKDEGNTLEKELNESEHIKGSEEEANTKKDKKGKKFFEMFSKYFWLGLVAVLASIILQDMIIKYQWDNFIVKLIPTLASTLGLTIIVASFFTYTLGTKEFIEYIEAKLEDIIIARNFLKNMDDNKKSEALHSILKPNKLQQKIYSNLNAFYEYYINDIMNVSEKNVRSDYNMSIEVHYDEAKGKIYAIGSVVYRLYPSVHGYVPITLGVEKDNPESKCTRLEIFDEDGKCEKIKLETLEYKENTKHDNMKIASVPLDEYSVGNEGQHLTIELDFKEYGFDHWMAFKFLVFQPTDGINFEIKCNDSIKIKERIIYDLQSKYHISVNEDSRYKISSHQWIEEGSGLMIIVSKPDLCPNCSS